MGMFRKLLTFDEAKKAISERMKPKPLGVDEVPLLEAVNRVLARDVVSSLDIPPFDRSTVDGLAVRAEDTFGAEENQPVKLKVAGSVVIGELPNVSVAAGNAAEIVTGAPIPEGADAVVMVEDTDKEDDIVKIFSSVTKNENVQKKGSDIKNGEIALKESTVLGSREIGVLAALGLAKVKVFRIPVVAVLSTGGEVTEPGKELSEGRIYDINAYSLSAAVLEAGGKAVYYGVVPDEKSSLRSVLEKALTEADVVLTSGGVSVGPKDIIPETLSSLGKLGLVFSGIALKPGKPATAALIDGKPVFSFPGHPTSALLTFHLLARPVIRVLGGRAPEDVASVKAVAGGRMFSAKGRRTFIMVKLKKDNAGFVADAVESGGSGAITTLAKADGYVEIPENQVFVDAGEEVRVFLFKEKV
jgi:molybdenum cofactor synthesis domain-containing protein